MEKRQRDYIRHLEKLDFDVISEEEIWEERERLELKLTEIHQEMIRLLIPTMTILVCTCIFLAFGLYSFSVFEFVAAALMAIALLVLIKRYNEYSDVSKKLESYVDKLIIQP